MKVRGVMGEGRPGISLYLFLRACFLRVNKLPTRLWTMETLRYSENGGNTKHFLKMQTLNGNIHAGNTHHSRLDAGCHQLMTRR